MKKFNFFESYDLKNNIKQETTEQTIVRNIEEIFTLNETDYSIYEVNTSYISYLLEEFFIDTSKEVDFIEAIHYIDTNKFSIVLLDNTIILFPANNQRVFYIRENRSDYNYKVNITNTAKTNKNYNTLAYSSLMEVVDILSKNQERFLYAYCSSKNTKEIELACEFIKEYFRNANLFMFVRGCNLRKAISEKFNLEERMEVISCLAPSYVPLPFNNDPYLDIRKLSLKDFEFVKNNYDSSDDYIKARIREGMFGAFYKEKPVGFIGTHEEGSMGLLFVLPEFRERGIGTLLERTLIYYLRKIGHRTFGQIETRNELSLNLHSNSGYTIGEETAAWFW